jgi:glutathione reductase (NADPH)
MRTVTPQNAVPSGEGGFYGFKTLIEEGSERVLGAHLVGPHADEVINLFGLAIRHGLSAEALKQTIFAYPTGASDIGYML